MADNIINCIFIIKLCIFGSAISQNIGDSCIDVHTSTHGVCKLATECRSAFQDLTLSIRPTICSYSRDTAVVCCRDGGSISIAAPEITSQRWSSSQYPNYAEDGLVWPEDSILEDEPRTKQFSTINEPTSKAKTNSRKRISEIKCDEYSQRVTEKISYISLLPDPEPMELETAKCEYDRVTLIVGGDPAELGEFPHMAAIGWSKVQKGFVFKCGGSLISDRFVLTAGHCLRTIEDTTIANPVPAIVRLGDHNLQEDVYDGADPIDVPIKRTLKHPGYKPPKRYNDIGLLELEYKVQFSSFIRPACLWNKNDFDGRTAAVATGWGAIAYHGARSDELLKVSLHLYESEVCQPLLSSLQNRNWKQGFSPQQVCAGNLTGLQDTCQGDSGGPLQVASQNNQCIFYVVGVTSFGPDCGKVNGPGVYTRVSSYIGWIEENVWKTDF